MPQTFFERLHDYFLSVGNVLRGEASSASIFPNKSDIGTSREKIYADFLRMHVPRGCHVDLGGFVFGQDGKESNQIDIIVTSDSALQYNLHNSENSGKTFSCIDGTIAVASIKSNLDSTQLCDALQNIASLPEKLSASSRFLPFLQMPERFYDDWPVKIIYASNGISLDSLTNTLLDFYKNNPNIPFNKRPNIIHVIGKYTLVRTYQNTTKADGSTWPANTYYPHPDATDVYGLSYAISLIQEIVMAERFLIQSYGSVLNKIQAPSNGSTRWVRVK